MERVPESSDEFAAFFQLYRPLVFSTAMRVLRDKFAAEDTVQSVFMRVWSNPRRFRGGNIEGWLTTVTKHVAIDRLRSDERQRSYFEEPTGFSADGPEDITVRRVLYDAVVDELKRMKGEQRDVLHSVLVLENTHAFVSEKNCIPLGTVKTRVRAGLAQLRRRFA